MLLKKKINKKKMFNKLALFIISFFVFGIIYYIFCDDYEFGGINILQEEIRKSSVKKFVNKVEKGYIDNATKREISDQISEGDIDKDLDNKLSKETNKISIKDSVKKKSRMQKFFDRMYFSIVTGTTLGYGDIYPMSNKLKLIVILQLLTTISIIFY